MSKPLTPGQSAVLRILVGHANGEMPRSPIEIGDLVRYNVPGGRALTEDRHLGSWAGKQLRALQNKGLAYTDAPGAAKGFWRPTEEGIKRAANIREEAADAAFQTAFADMGA